MSERDLRAERDLVQGLYAQGRSGALIAAVVGGLVVAGMWRSVPHALLAAWFAVLLADKAVRIAMVWAFQRENPSGARLRVWARRYTAGIVAAGAILGSAGPLMLPYAPPLAEALLLVVLLGMAAGSITGIAYHPPAMVAYPTTTLLPSVAYLLLQGSLEQALLGIAIAIGLVAVLMFGRNQARLIRSAIAIGHENADLLEELRSKTEIAEAAQRRAEQASLAKSQFFAAASHDLRQPMQALGLYAASLREVKREPEDARKIDQILSSVDALESLFDELLDISKLDAGYVEPSLSHFAARTLFERLESAYAPIARKSGLYLKLKPSAAVLHSDPVLLERVLGNLVSNGLRYTEAGGVTVACDARGIISVEDTGIGIPAHEQAKVFDEFYQLENPERDRRKGLGLGLATVRRITTLLAHPLKLESDVGRGTRFILEVPPGDPAAAAGHAAAPRAAELDALAGRRVLVIEDEASVREGLVQLLRDWRCQVVAASSLREAIGLLEDAPEAIVADYRLREGRNGIEAIRELRERFAPSLPAILVTGDTAPEIFASARANVLPLLTKPVRAARLRAALTHLLSRRQESGTAVA
jgi:signal transduction histidine kinase/ActR/RegA family two-component response regulator